MVKTDGSLELLTDKNSVLVLVAYQASMFKSVASGDKSRIKMAAICAAKAANILGIPVVLSSINPKYNGEFIPEISKLFPDQVVWARKMPSFDAFEDEGMECVSKGRAKEPGCFGTVDQHVLCLHHPACPVCLQRGAPPQFD